MSLSKEIDLLLTHCIRVYSIQYLSTQGRGEELTREKVTAGAIVHTAPPVENTNMTDCMSSLYIDSIKHQ
jgi:hypothetical protein